MDDLEEVVVGPGATPVGPPEATEEDAGVRLRDIVLDTSTTLMSAEPDEFDMKLRWGLGSVGAAIDAGRAYVFRSRGDAFELTDEWTTDGVRERAVRHMDLEEYAWVGDYLGRFENAVASSHEDLPEGVPFQADMRSMGVGAAVLVPLVDDWSLHGFAGFEVEGTARAWNDAEVALLRTTGDMIGHSMCRVRRERTLQEQNERLETFASVVSHDLRNPLNVLKGSLELARDGEDGMHLDRATDAADRMEEIIQQVLTLAKQGQDIGEVEHVSLECVVESAWKTVDTEGAELAVDGDIEVDRADPDRLQEAFENLFRNAVEHGSTSSQAKPDDAVEHGSTGNRAPSGDPAEPPRIRVGPLDGGFYIADDGPGIPEDRRKTVFEHGYTTEGGTGLGLAVVQRVIEAHGWSIEATESTSGGARFEVRFDADDG